MFEVNEKISHPSSVRCNSSFEEGVFPDNKNIAQVTQTHKKGSANDVNNCCLLLAK